MEGISSLAVNGRDRVLGFLDKDRRLLYADIHNSYGYSDGNRFLVCDLKQPSKGTVSHIYRCILSNELPVQLFVHGRVGRSPPIPGVGSVGTWRTASASLATLIPCDLCPSCGGGGFNLLRTSRLSLGKSAGALNA